MNSIASDMEVIEECYNSAACCGKEGKWGYQYPQFNSCVFKRNVERAMNKEIDISSTINKIKRNAVASKNNFELAELLSHSETTVGADYWNLEGYFSQIKNKSSCLPVHLNEE